MLRKTHIACGIASSLLMMQPQSLMQLFTSVIGGAFGGWIVDIDQKSKDTIELNLVIIIVVILLSCFQPIQHKLIYSIFLLLLSIFGYCSAHRTFMHSLTAMLLYTCIVYNL